MLPPPPHPAHPLAQPAMHPPASMSQVLVGDAWGTVRGWGPPGDMAAAGVACRELGMADSGSVFVPLLYNSSDYGSRYAPGSWLDNITCTGGLD